jgi:Type II secretion system (T2SS), protein M subtype b
MTPRDRRALLVGAAAIVGGAVAIRVVPWSVHAVTGLGVRVEQQSLLATEARAVLAAAPEVRDSLGRVLTGIVALAPVLVDGHTTAEAQASLSALVSLAANRHALKVVRLDPLADSAAGVFSRVTVHAELEGDIAGLVGLLRAVETSEPLLSIGTLAVSAPDPHANLKAAEVLHFELDVTGYFLPRGAQ